MPELVFELGCEELPAGSVARASHDLARHIETALAEAGIGFERTETFATPRRLIVIMQGIDLRQPDRNTTNRGPALSSAFDADGNPTKALEGFCRGQGISPAEVRREGDYVWVDKVVAGRPSAEVLAEVLPASVRSLTFDKTMRWGASRMRFARPIRWIVAVFDGQIVNFDIEGVVSGGESRGHRFYAPQPFPVRTGGQFIRDLEAHQVQPDAAKRRAMILAGAELAPTGCQVEWSDDLIDENVYLTEWPQPLLGNWSSDYLELPEDVLITAMAKHERMFPVRQGQGKLAPHFLWIRNSGEEDTVRGGNQWVLNARFNDAKFFFDEDKKYDLNHFLGMTEAMLFQDKLGTVRQRAERLEGFMDATIGGENARLAGRYAKADLTTGLVGELASLQGKVGGEYARREGLAAEVCDAIGIQYVNPADAELSPLAAGLIAADQYDKLAGYLGIGVVPSGSSDPMGLRRAATYLISLGFAGHLDDLRVGLEIALKEYQKQGIAVDPAAANQALMTILEGRYQAMVDARYDILNAALTEQNMVRPARVLKAVEELTAFQASASNVETALRPVRIVNSTLEKGHTDWLAVEAITDAALNSAEGSALLAQLKQTQPGAAGIASLCPAIHAFFESTMIMDDNADTRRARLSLAKGVRDKILEIGDLTKLVIEG
ncbi:MAG: glycine--tRNA ligase subunit beta [Chthonomonas sp.]|nr:glycine--tRNA ligase subunit beta [Chthonomonas sp.]